jgi:hypothetical protein
MIVPAIVAFLGLMATKRKGNEQIWKISRRLRKAPIEEPEHELDELP